MKCQNKGVFIDKKRSGRPKVTTSTEDRLMRKAVTRSPISIPKKIQPKLMETRAAVSTKTIQRRLSRTWPQIMQANPKTALDSGDEEEMSGLRQETC